MIAMRPCAKTTLDMSVTPQSPTQKCRVRCWALGGRRVRKPRRDCRLLDVAVGHDVEPWPAIVGALREKPVVLSGRAEGAATASTVAVAKMLEVAPASAAAPKLPLKPHHCLHCHRFMQGARDGATLTTRRGPVWSLTTYHANLNALGQMKTSRLTLLAATA